MHTLEQLNAFIAVYDCGSYSAAGRKLAKDRTTVRELVHAYEDILGYRLFDIVGRQAIATQQAQPLYPIAVHVLRQNNLLIQLNQSQLAAPISELKISYDGDFPVEFIRRLDEKIKENAPGVRLKWLQFDRDTALKMVEEQHIHFAFSPARMNVTPNEDILYKNLGYVDYNVYVGQRSPLLKQSDFTLVDAQGEEQLICQHTALAKSVIQEYSAIIKTVACYSLLTELLQNSGWAMIPNHIARQAVERKQITRIKSSVISNNIQVPFSLFYNVTSTRCELSKQCIEWSDHIAQRLFN